MLDAAFAELKNADDALTRDTRCWSLCPARPRATSLLQLGERLLRRELSSDVVAAFASGLCGIARAVLRNFPGNLFWDFDYLAASLLGATRNPHSPESRISADAISARTGRIIALQELFSHRSGIQFRYAHDFLYGFDWAKWVSRDSATRIGVGPFDLEFVTAMHERGTELLDLIAHDDDKYPALPEGCDRNPFVFSRDPETEARLHRQLAEQRLLPLEAWRFDADPDWRRPYAELRKSRAELLKSAE